MHQLTIGNKLHYTLRFASAMCFIGHGAFGIITKTIWCNYFGVFGIGQVTAYHLMPYVGLIDILMGISLLVYPTRAVVAWLVIWGFATALLRPLSGEPIAELMERGGNFGAPLALLILSGFNFRNIKSWFSNIDPDLQIDAQTLVRVTKCLRIIAFLLLAGHGWLNLIEKKGIMGQYSSLGFSNTAATAQIVGLFEIIAALIVLIKPTRSLVLFFLVWKIATELFYPHWEAFEWIERGGSYGVLLALWLSLPSNQLFTHKKLLTS